jgi:hypothetical protein
MIGTYNTTVYAIREARTLRQLAEIGKRRRKTAGRVPPSPLTREQRVHRYANQSGWTSAFTPKQRRRLDHKEGHAKANYSGMPAAAILTVADEPV